MNQPPTTPETVTSEILDLTLDLSPTEQPQYVPVVREMAAVLGECYDNVKAKVQRDGGTVCHGWIIWEESGRLIEAEFHCCWRSPSGALLDITPKIDGEHHILFLPDPARCWEGVFVPNVRHPLVDDPAMRELLAHCEELDRLKAIRVARGAS